MLQGLVTERPSGLIKRGRKHKHFRWQRIFCRSEYLKLIKNVNRYFDKQYISIEIYQLNYSRYKLNCTLLLLIESMLFIYFQHNLEFVKLDYKLLFFYKCLLFYIIANMLLSVVQLHITQLLDPYLYTLILYTCKHNLEFIGCHDTQHNDAHHNDIQHNDTQHKGLICDTHHK